MFKIGEFSKLSNVSIRMLRHYDKLELLIPDKIDEITGFRFYSAIQLEKVNKIQYLKSLGFSLVIVKELLDNHIDDISTYLKIREKEIIESLEAIKLQKKMLEQAFQYLKKERVIMNYKPILKEIPKRKVISYRNIIDTYHDEGKLWTILYEEIGKQQIKIAKDEFAMAIFHDKEYKEKNVDVEIQISVEGIYQNTEIIKFLEIPKISVVSVTFNGSYEQMGDVTKALADFIELNNYQMKGELFNIYHVSPAQDPNPNNWVTETCIPIIK